MSVTTGDEGPVLRNGTAIALVILLGIIILAAVIQLVRAGV